VEASKHLQLFEALEEKDTPESFGLCSNADVSVQKLNVLDILAHLKNMNNVVAKNTEFDKDKWMNGLGNILKIWKTVYKQLADSGVPKIKEEDLMTDDPINSFVLGEIRTVLSFIKKLAESFRKIIQVIKGEIPLEKDVELLGNNLLEGKIPAEWDDMFEGQPSPADWLFNYFKKIHQLKAWYEAVSVL
jgi:hypothetical protein